MLKRIRRTKRMMTMMTRFRPCLSSAPSSPFSCVSGRRLLLLRLHSRKKMTRRWFSSCGLPCCLKGQIQGHQPKRKRRMKRMKRRWSPAPPAVALSSSSHVWSEEPRVPNLNRSGNQRMKTKLLRTLRIRGRRTCLRIPLRHPRKPGSHCASTCVAHQNFPIPPLFPSPSSTPSWMQHPDAKGETKCGAESGQLRKSARD